MQTLVQENEAQFNDDAAEASFEAIVQFNEDMRTLACNAFQLREIFEAA